MPCKPLAVRTLLITITASDHLFGGCYTLDPYQNCSFGCHYCDSTQDTIVYMKINAPEILKQELLKVAKGTIIVGSAHDPYQPAEQSAKLTRRLLLIIRDRGFPVHILTKSPLVLRDLDILKSIPSCRVTLSITCLSENLREIVEPKVPSTEKRLQAIEKLHQAGIPTGLAVIPLLPYLVDPELESIVAKAHLYQADYLLSKPLELKGEQYSRYLRMLHRHYPQLLTAYERLYHESYIPDKTYTEQLTSKLEAYCTQYGIPTHLPLQKTREK
jgi:DNA repair photolyase